MPRADKTPTRPELQDYHEWDPVSCFCLRCGKSARDVVNNRLELRCHAPPNLTAISHIIAHRRMGQLLQMVPGDLLPNPLATRSDSPMVRAQVTLADQLYNGHVRKLVDAAKPLARPPVYREREPLYGPSRPVPPEPEPAA